MAQNPAISFNSEKDFEDFLFNNQQFTLEQFGGDTLMRQVNLARYGICDLITFELTTNEHDPFKHLEINIIELKNTPLSKSHLLQCARYKAFFDRVENPNYEITVTCHLVGMQTFPTEQNLEFLAQSIDWLTVYETTLDPLHGIKFNTCEGWHHTGCDCNEVFNTLFNAGEENDS